MDDAERNLQTMMITLRNAGLDPAILPTLTYHELMAYLETPPIFNGVRAFLQAFLPLARQRNQAIPQPLQPVPFNMKVFMAAFHVSYCADSVFETMTDLATALKTAADTMVATVFRVHDCLAADTPLPTELTAAFLTNLTAYHRAFLAWKRADEQRLSLQIKAKLQALVVMLAVVDAPADGEIARSINEEITGTEGLLVRIAGQASLDEFNTFMAENRDRLIAEARTLPPA